MGKGGFKPKKTFCLGERDEVDNFFQPSSWCFDILIKHSDSCLMYGPPLLIALVSCADGIWVSPTGDRSRPFSPV